MADQAPKKWYLQKANGERWGPGEITSWHVEWGYLRPDTLVWTEGQPDWLPAEKTELRSLFADVKLPPPLPHEREAAQPLEIEQPAAPDDAALLTNRTAPPEDFVAQHNGAAGGRRSEPASNKGAKVSASIGWVCGVFLLAGGVPGIAASISTGYTGTVFVYVGTVVAGLLILPPVTRSLRRSMPVLKATWAPPALAFIVIFAIGMAGAVFRGVGGTVSTSPSSRSASGGEPRNDQTWACRSDFVAGGGDPGLYDWSRSYTSDAWPDIQGSVPTKIDGERIKCVVVPMKGVETDWSGCGLISAQPKDHKVCRMVFDSSQDVWVPTWKARSAR